MPDTVSVCGELRWELHHDLRQGALNLFSQSYKSLRLGGAIKQEMTYLSLTLSPTFYRVTPF
jgi:hypothetical protein